MKIYFIDDLILLRFSERIIIIELMITSCVLFFQLEEELYFIVHLACKISADRRLVE